MAKLLAIILGLVLACSNPARAEGSPKLDVATQKVLLQNGVDSKILRSYDQLGEASSRKDGRFFFSFEGTPGIQILLDRNYWVLMTWSAKRDSDVIGYMLNPEDGQSALNISIGHDVHDPSDATLSKDPGFSGITFGEGIVGGQKMKWRRWSDQNHLYSDCTLFLPSRDKSGLPDHKVRVLIVANTKERRSALEDCMPSLKLLDSQKVTQKPNHMLQPTAGAFELALLFQPFLRLTRR